MSKIKNLLIFSIFLSFITIEIGCKGDAGATGPTGPAGPSMMGNITGLVTLIDSNGVQPTNKSGVTVSIPGSSKTAITDSTGHWALDSMTTGTYEIDLSKNTFGMTKHLNQQLVGGGTLYIGTDILSQVPDFTVNLTSDSLGIGFVKIKGTLLWSTPQTIGRNILLFIGNQNNVSDNPANYLTEVNVFVSDTGTVFSTNINTSVFSDAGIQTGSNAYIIAYPSSAPAASSTRYADMVTGRFFYTSLGNQSNILTITTPSRFIYPGGKPYQN